MRTVYLGTSEFAADVLRVLAGSPHAPQLVVTRPDRPRGRGRKLASPPVLQVATELGIDTDQPESVNGEAARQRIAAATPDAVVVCAFGALIKEPLLSAHPMLNVHPSLLPRWRGAAPVERAIMAGDERTGVCIMRLTEGLDSGPVCLSAQEPIAADDTYGTLAARLAPLGGRLLVQALDTSPPFAEQDEAGATYAEKITAEDRLLSPGRPAAELERIVRALTPHIGAALTGVGADRSERLGVWEAAARAPQAGDPGPGELRLDGRGGRGPILGCTPGTLELITVQPAGRKAMPGEAYLRGLRS
ncbi:MAG TPA: methionyl-tRNA formyltransferase [Solirubrobacteraceae bacterium]|nr:methionyl-tRNA formyltransferase [Solirubrobacteraceae bacterium]